VIIYVLFCCKGTVGFHFINNIVVFDSLYTHPLCSLLSKCRYWVICGIYFCFLTASCSEQLRSIFCHSSVVLFNASDNETNTNHDPVEDEVTSTLWVKKLVTFSFEHNFGKCCLIFIILSLLQTEINYDKVYHKICHHISNLLVHYCKTLLVIKDVTENSQTKSHWM